MKKIIATVLVFLHVGVYCAPKDEGMWLPMLISRLNYAEMQKKGFRLTADEIYSVNQGSMKDAIVSLGGFCTGELISDQGLMLTNHHCAFSSIQFHSSVEKDYLTNGFWAYQKSEELPCPEIYASILVKMEDVTERMTKSTEKEKEMKAIVEEATKDTHYEGYVRDMFYGNQYFLFVYEKFTDVRLVGAPPSAIGKFGGDTDNWMWPRHTGDFSLFRVYSGKDGKPAAYSKDNVPYVPKYSFPVSIKGVKENDFAMVFGYPGNTDRYLVSDALDFNVNAYNPALIKTLGRRLEIMKKDMDASDDVRIGMADTYASLANSHKYFIGQTEGLKRMDVIPVMKKENIEFQKWADSDPTRKEKYGNLLPSLSSAYTNYKSGSQVAIYTSVGLFGPGIIKYANQYVRLINLLKTQPEKGKELIEKLKAGVDAQFKEYKAPTDEKLLAGLFYQFYEDIPKTSQYAVFKDIIKKYKGKTTEETFQKFAADMFKRSALTTADKATKLLQNATVKSLQNDPMIAFAEKLVTEYRASYQPAAMAFNQKTDELYKVYFQGLMEMNPGKTYYPDANSTLRMTYGTVQPYRPRDGVFYNYVTTSQGILEKMDNTNEEFMVPDKLAQLLRNKDFGDYAQNGELVVGFLTDNDITGGNSGSPVINGNGEIIGCAFDGNWEAMTGDLVYDGQLKRTICVDIRYVLFVIDKYAGAKNLIEEMKIRK